MQQGDERTICLRSKLAPVWQPMRKCYLISQHVCVCLNKTGLLAKFDSSMTVSALLGLINKVQIYARA